VKPYGLGKTV